MQEEKLFRKDFVFIIIINFLVFLNHLAILAALAFSNTSTATIATDSVPRSRFAEGMGIGGAIAGGLISSFGYETMFTGMSVFNLLSIVIYVLIGRNHPSSFSYRKRMAR